MSSRLRAARVRPALGPINDERLPRGHLITHMLS